MSVPSPELDDMSGWKLRLLGRIRDSVAHTAGRAHTVDTDSAYLGRGDPTDSGSTSQEAGADVAALQRYRCELEARAAAAGISDAAIEQARAGERCGPSFPKYRLRTNVDALIGETMIDALADQVWHLEHTSLVLVEYSYRTDARQIVQDLELLRDVERAMTASWYGITEGIDFAGLTVADATDLWTRDPARWLPLAQLVRGYDDTGLRQRLHRFASPEIEDTLRRLGGPDPFHIDHAVRIGTAPPTPYQLIESATDALHALDQQPSSGRLGSEPGPGLEAAAAEALTWTEAQELSPVLDSPSRTGPGSGLGM
ncbi:hypothetical protein [Nocardia testacea]|uniref:hypothetical protein n=1 Tax=Nocardia testacea TaxID=248551 RepID=UPI003A86899F